MSRRLSLGFKWIYNYERRDRMLKLKMAVQNSLEWSTINYRSQKENQVCDVQHAEAIYSFPVKSILTNRDQKANHIFGINPKCLFFRLKSLLFQAVVLLVFRKCRKRQCLEGFFSSSKTRQRLKLTWILRGRDKYSI